MKKVWLAASFVLTAVLLLGSVKLTSAQLQRTLYSRPRLPNLTLTRAILPVPLDPQETDEWCWAASAEMAMNYLAPCISAVQCNEANSAFGLTNACQCPTPTAAIKPGLPNNPLHQYGFTFNTTTSGTALSWAQVVNEIATNGRPFVFAWDWNSGGGHAMTAIGVTSFGAFNVVVAQPLAALLRALRERYGTRWKRGL